MTINDEIKNRQQKLLHAIGEGGVAILVGADEKYRNHDNNFYFRQHSDFYYLTGFEEPKAMAVFIPGRDHGQYILFSKAKDPLATIWTGELAGQEGAIKDYGADEAFAIEEAASMLTDLLANKERVYFGGNIGIDFFANLKAWCATIDRKTRQGINAPQEFITLDMIVHEMRLRKSAAEISLMKKSAEIAAGAHIAAMQATYPGKYEYEIKAEIMRFFLAHGGKDAAYETIVADGGNACILHYTKNKQKLAAGSLVLIDAGVEYQYYASDITRTFPVNGKFTNEQKIIYQAVLDVQLQVIAAVRPGVTWKSLQDLSEKLLAAKLLELKILLGSLDEVLQQKTFKQFYMHNISHWLGMDTHDVGRYQLDSKSGWRKLEPGMVLTVEPGIYIRADSEGVDRKWWNIGIRIEDDVLVTEHGCEVLTQQAPKEIAEIEQLMAGE